MILVLAGLCILVELILQAADHGLVGTERWRGIAYQNGAFWAGLFHDWRPNYAVQPWTMFLTYAFLHGGLGHLAGNMLTLWVLGNRLAAQFGAARLLVLYLASAIGGGLGFALILPSPYPMVGASGALFGLAGGLLRNERVLRRRTRQSLSPVWRAIAGLVVLNFLLWAALSGLLAWQTHLGGFVAGWLAAAGLSRIRPGAR